MDLVPIVKFDDIVTESGGEAGEVVLAIGMIGDGVGAIGWVTMQAKSRKMRRRIIKMSMQKKVGSKEIVHKDVGGHHGAFAKFRTIRSNLVLKLSFFKIIRT